jgi:hypothetical protein
LGTVLALLLLALPSTITPVTFGAEWDEYTFPPPHPYYGAGVITTYAGTPVSRGVATLYFPKGGRLWAYEWQIVVKRPGHVMLVALAILHADGTVTRIGRPEFLDHSTSPVRGQERTREMTLPRPMKLRPGDYVFIGMHGWGEDCPPDARGFGCSVVESHATLWVDEGTVAVEIQ